MRYAIISDVHSNVHALKSVMEDIGGQGADVILCAGDLVGYCPYPNEVIGMLRDRDAICIAGNHDRAVVNLDPTGMNPLAKNAIYWTAQRITDKSMNFLRKLKPRASLNLATGPSQLPAGG